MATKVAFLLASICVVLLAPSTSQMAHGDGSNYPMELTHVGTFDGKAFFGDSSTTTNRNWEAASTYCQSANLVLATVDTELQLVQLNSTLSYSYNYWTGGREPSSTLLSCLGGNGGGSRSDSVEHDVTETTTTVNPGTYFCVAVGARSGLSVRDCREGLKVLCQVP